MKAILSSEDGMFHSEYTLISWNVVLLLRGLTIVILKTSVINPIYRLLAFLPVFSLFIVHDRSAMPFKSNPLNLLQVLSSLSLNLLTACNLVSAFSYMADITGIPGMDIIIDGLGYLEKILFCGLIPVWLVIWKVWRRLEKKKRKKKKD